MRDKILINLCGYAMLMMMILIVVQVVARYVFSSPLSWSEELTRAIFVWFTMVGVYMAFRQQRNIGIEAIPRLFGHRGKQIMKAIENVIVLIFVGFMTYYGTTYSLAISQHTPALKIPMWLLYCIIPLSGVGIIIDGIRQIVILLRFEERAE